MPVYAVYFLSSLILITQAKNWGKENFSKHHLINNNNGDKMCGLI